LTYEVVNQLTTIGIGQSTCIGIGGDPIIGTNFIDALRLFEKDPGTNGVVLIGEIGGNSETEAAHWIKENMSKPVAAFVGGVTAPPGKRMGHAGAIISGENDTAKAKMKIMESCGIAVAKSPAEIGREMANVLGISASN
jgi:succinyl-CoA synthetase alpha subunit